MVTRLWCTTWGAADQVVPKMASTSRQLSAALVVLLPTLEEGSGHPGPQAYRMPQEQAHEIPGVERSRLTFSASKTVPKKDLLCDLESSGSASYLISGPRGFP